MKSNTQMQGVVLSGRMNTFININVKKKQFFLLSLKKNKNNLEKKYWIEFMHGVIHAGQMNLQDLFYICIYTFYNKLWM